MDKYIVNVQFADAIHQACENCVRHAALKVRPAPFNPMAILVHWYKPPTALNAVSALEASASLV